MRVHCVNSTKTFLYIFIQFCEALVLFVTAYLLAVKPNPPNTSNKVRSLCVEKEFVSTQIGYR
jgi:hypothetical protein